MKILAVSNLYPPHYIGGYELGCQQIVEALKQRGHQVKVLTSTYGIQKPQSDGETYRWLKMDTPWIEKNRKNRHLAALQKERVNQAAFKRVCRDFKPDIVYIWNSAHISISLAFLAQQMNIPVFYYISDDWLSNWKGDSWFSWCGGIPAGGAKRVAKNLIKFAITRAGIKTIQGQLDLRHVQFTSHFLKEKTLQSGQTVAEAQVIHWGIDVDRYACKKTECKPIRLLFVGQVAKHKGVHTAVEALKYLKEQNKDLQITLTIAGGGVIRSEEISLHDLVVSLGLGNDVLFTGLVPRSELIPIYQAHDILIFPSIWDEPFSITLLEGLSSGLAVVGTTTGGSQEILQNEVNALTFPAGEALACANQLQRLIEDQELYEKIRLNGRQTVVDHFQFEMMTENINSALQRTLP